MAKSVLLLAYTLAFAEVFVRLVSPQPVMPRYVTGTAWGVRGNITGAHYHQSTPETQVDFRINAEGMRDDRDFPLAKPAGTCRVALFGDSFFMGYELNLPDTFAARLESALRGQGLDVDVLNFAVSGFGTAEMLRAYERYGARFAPDAVVFSWHASDFNDNVASGLYALDDGRLVDGRASYLPSIALQDRLMRSSLYRLVADNSQLYSLVRERTAVAFKLLVRAVNQLRGHAGGVAADTSAANALAFESYPYATNLSAALLRRSASVVAAHGAAFLLAEIPFGTIGDTSDLMPTDLWNDIPRVSPLDAFRRAGETGKKIFYTRGEGHVTPAGASLLADVVARRLAPLPIWSACRAKSKVSSDLPVTGRQSGEALDGE